MSAHDVFGPSAAHRWMNCPGSAAFCADIPEEQSEYAAEGTLAHEAAAQAVVNRLSSDESLCRTLTEITKDEVMIEHAAAYANWLGAFDASTPFKHWKVEDEIDLSMVLGRREAKGTADFWAIDANDNLLVADFKYGRKPVEVKDNPQLMLYAAGIIASRRTAINMVFVAIYQPFCGGASLIDVSREELDGFLRLAKNKLSQAEQVYCRAKDGGIESILGALVPGPAQCAYCRGAATCPALAARVQEESSAPVCEAVIPEDPVRELPVPTDPERLARALPWLDLIESWCDKVVAAAKARIEAGESVPGYKLVAGRQGPRKWTDDAEERLNNMSINKSVLYEPKLISPTAAERAAKKGEIGPRQWKTIQQFIRRSEGKPALVPESDPREALQFVVADDFEDLGEEKPAVAGELPVIEQPAPLEEGDLF